MYKFIFVTIFILHCNLVFGQINTPAKKDSFVIKIDVKYNKPIRPSYPKDYVITFINLNDTMNFYNDTFYKLSYPIKNCSITITSKNLFLRLDSIENYLYDKVDVMRNDTLYVYFNIEPKNRENIIGVEVSSCVSYCYDPKNNYKKPHSVIFSDQELKRKYCPAFIRKTIGRFIKF